MGRNFPTPPKTKWSNAKSQSSILNRFIRIDFRQGEEDGFEKYNNEEFKAL